MRRVSGRSVRYIIVFHLFFLLCCTSSVWSQDTFYVSKKKPPAAEVVVADTTQRDSILTFTVEYFKGNQYVVLHLKGPYLSYPPDAPRNKRMYYSDIIACDRTGRRYKLPPRYYIPASGTWVINPPR